MPVKKVAVKRPPAKKGGKTTAKKPSFFSSSTFFKLILVFSLIVVIYSQRDVLAYYLGFKTDKIFFEPREVTVNKVLDAHIEKSFGIDISEYQDKINWDKVKEIDGGYPIEYVFVRASIGNERADKKFKKYWKKAKEKGFVCGAYHYYRPNENSLEQAENFITTVKLQKGDLPPVLDIEKLPKSQSIDSLKVGLRRWLKKVEKHYKVKPIIYSGESYYTDFLKKEFSDYPLWIANYNFWRNDLESDWLFWQFTEKAQIHGIEGMVDINIFNGDKNKLLLKCIR